MGIVADSPGASHRNWRAWRRERFARNAGFGPNTRFTLAPVVPLETMAQPLRSAVNRRRFAGRCMETRTPSRLSHR